MKYLKITLFAVSFFLSIFVLYIEIGGRYILSNNDKRIITWNIRSNSELPENFTHFYNTVYSNSLSGNSWNLTINILLGINTTRKECPCSQMSYRIFPSLEIKNKSSIDYFLVARYIEHNFSQRECLNFNFNKFDFLENRKGIKQTSMSLFNKNIESLQPIEVSEILALYENPVKNNRFRNPERAKSRTQYFYNLYSENLKK